MSRQARLISATVIVCAIVFPPASVVAQTGAQKPSRTGTISGRVTVGGKPTAGLTIAAYNSEVPPRGAAAARSVTDNEGRYRLSSLPAGQYQVASLTPDLTAEDPASERTQGFSIFSSTKNVTLSPGEDVEDIDLHLMRGAVITGRVVDGDNKPVVQEQINLQMITENGSGANARLPYGGDMYQTDDRGIYRIFGLSPGRYKLSVGFEPGGGMAYGSRGYYLRTFYPDTLEESKARIIELAPGAEATNIDIQVGVRSQTFHVAGSVVDSETGQPVVGAYVSYLVNLKNGERNSPFLVGLATGLRGEFQTDGLTPGSYGAYVASDFQGGDYYSDVVPFEVVDKDVTGIEVRANRGLTVSGVVINESGIELPPFERLRIAASLARPPTGGTSAGSGVSWLAADGSFRIGGLRPGRVSFYVYPSGAPRLRPTIDRVELNDVALPSGLELQPGQSVSGLRVFLNYGTGVIRGTIRFEGGVVSSDTNVIIRYNREGSRNSAGAYLDSRGHFLIKGLLPGSYEVQVMVNRTTQTGPGAAQPEKQLVQVTNDGESEVIFVVDLTPK